MTIPLRELSRGLAAWSSGRWLVAVATAVLVVLGQLAAAPGGTPLPWWWWATTTVTSTLAALVLASYLPVPGSGRRFDVGCTPCATLAGGLAAFAVIASLGSIDASGALIAIAIVAAGLYQRLHDAGTCPTSSAVDGAPSGRLHPQNRAL